MERKWHPTSGTHLPIYVDSPSDFFSGFGKEPKCAKEYYEKLGFTNFRKANDYFYWADFPENWTIQEEGYWPNVYDDKDRLRFSFFIKICPWDTDGFLHQNTRYSYKKDYTKEYDPSKDEIVQYYIYDADGTILHECKPILVKNESGKYAYETEDARLLRIDFHKRREIVEKQQQAECQQWLNEHFPNWKDIYAYW